MLHIRGRGLHLPGHTCVDTRRRLHHSFQAASHELELTISTAELASKPPNPLVSVTCPSIGVPDMLHIKLSYGFGKFKLRSLCKQVLYPLSNEPSSQPLVCAFNVVINQILTSVIKFLMVNVREEQASFQKQWKMC